MKKNRVSKKYIAVGVLVAFVMGIFYFLPSNPQSNTMKVAFLSVGQGDSIFIQAPNGAQMLVDGGRGAQVLSALGEVMPFGDRSLDVVIGMHPDADHIGGLVDVLGAYEVGSVIEPGAQSKSKIYQTLENNIDEKNITHILARAGMRIMLDKEKNVYFDILYPDRDVTNWETNEASIVGKLVYGETSVMLTGDSSSAKELLLVNKNPQILDVDILKLGHHGSRTSSALAYLKATTPRLAIISAGLNNSYGHPHKEVLGRLQSLEIPYLATYKEGTIVCTSDAITILCK